MNTKLLLIAGAAVTSAGIYSAATFAASVTSTADANVIAPMTITETTVLNFGDISVDAVNPGTVTLDATSGNRTDAGGATAVLGGADARGVYTLGGVSGKAYSISIPGINLTSGGNILPAVFTNTASGTLPAATEVIGVGGTVSLSAGQAPGLYQGDYTITVDYN